MGYGRVDWEVPSDWFRSAVLVPFGDQGPRAPASENAIPSHCPVLPGMDLMMSHLIVPFHIHCLSQSQERNAPPPWPRLHPQLPAQCVAYCACPANKAFWMGAWLKERGRLWGCVMLLLWAGCPDCRVMSSGSLPEVWNLRPHPSESAF